MDSVFTLRCPGPTLLEEMARIQITLTSNDSSFSFTVEELDGADVSTQRLPLDADNSDGGLLLTSTTPGSAVVVVTETAADGIQLGSPLECTVEFVETIDCDGPFAQEGLGEFCMFDADCNQCQVCLRLSSVPSSTCAPQIPCESSLDCLDASMGDQFSVNFCEDDGFCR